MLYSSLSAGEKRVNLRAALRSGKALRFPGAYSPLVSLLIEKKNFDGVYVSGAVLANDLGLPDVGLTSLTEVAQRAHAIARVTHLPALVDLDTGFGEPLNAARAVQEMEEAGLCGAHIEDQQFPKRCGHLDGKSLVPVAAMVQKIRAAHAARRDPNFLLVARTDARGVEGFEAAVERARAYLAAGADMIFPEALANAEEFARFRQAVAAPLMANMTEFGKSPLLSYDELARLGYNLIIYPVTTQRLAMFAVERGLDVLLGTGTQESLLPAMQTRKDLYSLLAYSRYAEFDSEICNFNLD